MPAGTSSKHSCPATAPRKVTYLRNVHHSRLDPSSSPHSCSVRPTVIMFVSSAPLVLLGFTAAPTAAAAAADASVSSPARTQRNLRRTPKLGLSRSPVSLSSSVRLERFRFWLRTQRLLSLTMALIFLGCKLVEHNVWAWPFQQSPPTTPLCTVAHLVACFGCPLRLGALLFARKTPLFEIVIITELLSILNLLAPLLHGEDVALVVGFEFLAQLPALWARCIPQTSPSRIASLHTGPLFASRLALLHYIIHVSFPRASFQLTPIAMILCTAAFILALLASVAVPYRPTRKLSATRFQALDILDFR